MFYKTKIGEEDINLLVELLVHMNTQLWAYKKDELVSNEVAVVESLVTLFAKVIK